MTKKKQDDLTEMHALDGDELPEIAPPVPPAEPERVTMTRGTSAAHALDAAPLNSKLVLVRTEGVLKAVLCQPDGTSVLDPTDPASKLPEGAVIQKTATGFRAEQLSPAFDYPELVTKTASEAIAGFVPHFHRPE